jgi:hypothetical protein
MAANSKHYGDLFLWLKKIIASCESEDQLQSAERMVTTVIHKITRDGNYMHRIEMDLDDEIAKVAKTIG